MLPDNLNMSLRYIDGEHEYTHKLIYGNNIIGSHIEGFQSNSQVQIPQYALKINVCSEEEVEIEVMNTHFGTKDLEFGKYKPDGSLKVIKPGRVYIVEDGDEFGYKDSKISLLFVDPNIANNYQLKKMSDEQGEIVDDDIINAPTQLQPKSILVKPDRANNQQKRESENSIDLINAQTQIVAKDLFLNNKGPQASKEDTNQNKEIQENRIRPRHEESKDEFYNQSTQNANEDDLDDSLINAATLIVPKDLKERPQEQKKRVGFALPENFHQNLNLSKPKPAFTATNAPTVLVQKPLELKPEPKREENALNEIDYDAPTLIVNQPLQEKPEKSIAKRQSSGKDSYDLLNSIGKDNKQYKNDTRYEC